MGKRNRRVEIISAIISPHHKDIAIYSRVSTSEKVQQDGLDNQVKGLKDLVRQNENWTLGRVYEDIQPDGSTFRPEFEQMMRDAAYHEFDLIEVKSISHFSRNTADFWATINKLHSLGIEVGFESEQIKSTNPTQRLMMEVKSAFAQVEKIHIIMQVGEAE